MMNKIKIKVLGPGCINCEILLERTKKAVKEMGIEADIDYITDIPTIKKYVMITPGLVVNEKVVHQGRPIPTVELIKELISKEL